MVEINSPQNSQFRLWKSLLDSRGLKKEGLALLSGRKIVPEVLSSKADEIVAVLSTKKSDRTLHPQARFYVLSKDLFDQLDVLGTKGPLLVTNTPPLALWDGTETARQFEMLLALGDPSNLGAVLRSCLAFGVARVVLLKECAHPFLPKVLKTSAGAGLHLELVQGPSIQDLKISDGLGLDLHGTPLPDFRWPRSGRLVLGEEGPGLPKNVALQRISIPMSSEVESLNAAVAASIALYARSAQLKLP